jgi:hypothetical protein
MKVKWSKTHCGRFTSKETPPGTSWIGTWVDPIAGLNAVAEKNFFFLCQKKKKLDSKFDACVFQAVRPLICRHKFL